MQEREGLSIDKDMSKHTTSTASVSLTMDMSEPCHYSASWDNFSTVSSSFQQDSCSVTSNTASSRGRMPRFFKSMRGSFRGITGQQHGGTQAGRARSTPKREDTFNTSQSSVADLSTEMRAQWEEERVELNEQIEALEKKLQTKEAALQAIMMQLSSQGGSAANVLNVASGQQQRQQYQIAMAEKNREIQRLEAQVCTQANQLITFETQQKERIQREAELIFEEWQEQENDESLLEKLQEQSEMIERLKAERDFQQHQHERRRERELEEKVQRLQLELQEQRKLATKATTGDVNLPAMATAVPNTIQLEQENAQLQALLEQSLSDMAGYRGQVETLTEMVHKMESDKENEIHLLDIVMSQLNDALEQQELSEDALD